MYNFFFFACINFFLTSEDHLHIQIELLVIPNTPIQPYQNQIERGMICSQTDHLEISV